MLKLLLDEHISPTVAKGLRLRHESLTVHFLGEWEGGRFLGQEDSACIEHAARQRITLVAYDRRTIPPLLKTWAEAGWDHGGIIFINQKTIAPSDIGGQVRALSNLVKQGGKWDWTNRVCFLQR
jgi:hypothetical protein